MIFHVCLADNDWPPQNFLKHFSKPVGRRFMTIHTHQLGLARALPFGTYLFTDLERQSTHQRQLQAQIWDQLSAHPQCFRLLNHPERALRRLELLETLNRSGTNEFRAFRVSDIPRDLRYPVFLRREDNHEANMTPLIEDSGVLEEQIARFLLAGVPAELLLAVEFCDTADAAGIYRKYSAFRIGDQIIPRHLVFGDTWMRKQPDLIDRAKLEEERAYLEGNPHAAELARIFDEAHIDYGRIDYSLKDGRLQVWEINTNPIVTLAPSAYRREHFPAQQWFAERAETAFLSLDTIHEEGKLEVRLEWPALGRQTAKAEAGLV